MVEPLNTPATVTDDDRRRRGWHGIRPRLVGVLLVPTIAALAFGALRMQGAVEVSAQAARAETIASALPDSFGLAVQLTVERDVAGAGAPQDRPTRRLLAGVREATDTAAADWRALLPRIDYSDNAALQEDLIAVGATLDGLDDLREEIADPQTREDAQAAYTRTVNVLLGLSQHLPELHDDALHDQATALAEVRRASEALGAERVLMGKALAAGEIGPTELVELAEARTAWTGASERFYDATSPAAQAGFDALGAGTAGDGASGHPMQAAVDEVLRTGDIASVALTPEEWNKASADFVGKMEGVIVRAASDLADDVSASRAAAERTAVLAAVLIFVVLFAALGIAMFAARSILRPLGRLRQAALDIASNKLPERVRELEQADEPVDVSVARIDVGRRDEIGEVAEAFDAVHSEAVRLAGEQARMRANVNRMFVYLSRRSQGLVERQLRLIDQLEADEQDPAALANLFRLDHLATRMRRNDESLLVLAGGDTGQADRGPVPVLDVLRAAASEIEQFERVDIDSVESARLRGPVAGDLVHLLAELVENATNFSPPDTRVVVRTSRNAERLVVEVIDFGVGMTPLELAAANGKLRRSTGLDADVARMMGLVVTAHLADRHGLSVELFPNQPRGVVARVEVPLSAVAVAAVPSPTPAAAPAPGPAAAPAAGQASAPAPAPHPTGGDVRRAGSDRPVAPGPVRTFTAARGASYVASSSTSALDGPAPASGPQDDDVSPIFDALQSEWFTRRRSPRSGGWSSPGDDGWRRASEVASSQGKRAAAVTAGGLPVRVPGQNLVPGAASAVATPPRPPARPADAGRARTLSSFQQGVSRARGTAPRRPDHEEERP